MPMYEFDARDEDIDKGVLEILGELARHVSVDMEYIFQKAQAKVRGNLTLRRLSDRMLDMRLSSKRLICVPETVKGKKRSLYRLRTDTDNERPTWNTS